MQLTAWLLSGADSSASFARSLVLRKEGSQIRFYVNGYQVHDMSAEPFFGNGVGFETYNNLEIDFDDLVVTTR
jgi:hypothetical protein